MTRAWRAHDKSLTAKIKVQKVKPKLNKEPENRAQKLTWTDSLTIASRNRSWAIASAHGRPRSQSLVGDCERSQSLTVAIARGRLRALTVAHRHSLVFARGRLRALTSEKIKFDVASEKSVTVNIARRATYKRQRSTVIAHDRSWSLISDKDRDRYFRVDERRTFDYERPSSTTSAYSRLWSTIVAVSLAEKYP